jgi:hypothetical protein
LAERFRRTIDWLNRSRVCGPHHRVGRGAFTSDPAILCTILERNQDSSVPEQGCAAFSCGSADWSRQITANPRRTRSPLRPDIVFDTHNLDVAAPNRLHVRNISPPYHERSIYSFRSAEDLRPARNRSRVAMTSSSPI